MISGFALLRQPETSHELSEKDGALVAPDGTAYPIINGIPRFVTDGYAEDFGWQWKRFRQTQLDSYSGLTISHDRLEKCLHGHLSKLQGKSVLEAGSGAGRFTEPLLKTGANLCSFDLSAAVEANAENNGNGFTLAQADIMKIPFAPASFDYVICLGVVQHTPNPENTIRSLYSMVKPGGYLSIDHYIKSWRWVLPPPIGYAINAYRQLILALPRKKRFTAVEKIVKFWFPLHWKFRDSRYARTILPRLSPVAFYYPGIPLKTKEEYYEWALLDTHDSLTDYYKHVRNAREIETALRGLGATDIQIVEAGNGVEAFCRKPAI